MKRLDLNITLREPVKGEKDGEVVEPRKLAIQWIGVMLERAINKPDNMGRSTKSVSMDLQRKYYKIMNILETHKDGVVELEDEDFNFLDRKFHQAELPIQKNIAEILVKIEDVLNKAKIPEKKEDEAKDSPK